MASKNPYQDYNQDALDHFNLDEGPQYGVLSSLTEVSEVLITQDETKYKNIRNILSIENIKPTALSSCKRGFILPNCPISQDRVKAAAKEKGITITNDYEKADFIITHDNFSKKFSHGEKIHTKMLMYRLWNYEAFTGGCTIIDDYSLPVIYDNKLEERVKSWNCTGSDSLMDEWGITGMALNIAFLIDTGALKVISGETLLHSSANLIDLTQDLVEEITQWVDSYDQDNIAVAAKILPTINYTKNTHLLWQLAQNIYGRMYNFNRDKDVQFWLGQSRLQDLYHYTAQDMILNLEQEDKLDTISFRYLEKIVRQEIRIDNRDLYTFKVSVKPEYKKYLK
jgi:hypothetical protein